MFDIKRDAVTQPPKEDTLSSKVAEYTIFHSLVTFIEMIINAKEIEVDNFAGLLDMVLDSLDEEQEAETKDLLYKFLKYLKVSDSAIEDLLDEDKEISRAEFEALSELLSDRLGNNSVYDFVGYAINNPELPDVPTSLDEDSIDLDSIQMDWSFYPDKGKCNAKKTSKQACIEGAKNGIMGFWRYKLSMVGKNKDGDEVIDLKNYKESKTKDFSEDRKTALATARADANTTEAKTKRKKSMNARNDAKLKLFGGYAPAKPEPEGSKTTSNEAGV